MNLLNVAWVWFLILIFLFDCRCCVLSMLLSAFECKLNCRISYRRHIVSYIIRKIPLKCRHIAMQTNGSHTVKKQQHEHVVSKCLPRRRLVTGVIVKWRQVTYILFPLQLQHVIVIVWNFMIEILTIAVIAVVVTV